MIPPRGDAYVPGRGIASGVAEQPDPLNAASLIAILVFAAVLRVHGLGRECFWYDEVVTMRLARSPSPTALIHLLERIDGSHAPLHPLLLQGWVRLFGPSETSARTLSAACGVLTVAMVALLGRQLFDPATGRWGAWLTAVSPPLVHYARETRMYALLVLLCVVSWWLLLGFRQTALPSRKLAYAGSLAALFYTHPLGLFMIAALAVAYLLLRPSLALGLRPWLAIQLGTLIAILPWIWRNLDHTHTDYPIPLSSVRFLLAIPIEFVGGNSLAFLVCLAIILGGLAASREPGSNFRPATEPTALLVWLMVPPMLLYLYSYVITSIFGPPRYHIFIAPAYLLLLARGLVVVPPPFRWSLAAGGLVLSLSLIQADVYSQVVKADWRGLAGWLQREQARGAIGGFRGKPVVVVHPSDPRFPRDQVEAARYYLEPAWRVVAGAAVGSRDEGGTIAAELGPVLEVDCLSAEQVRGGFQDPSGLGFRGLVVHLGGDGDEDDGGGSEGGPPGRTGGGSTADGE